MNLRLKTLITLIILGCVGCMVFLMGTSFRRKGGVAETTIREGVNHAATIVISNNNRITKDLTIPIPSEEVELVEISSIEKGISRQKAFQMQSSQCSATMSAARSSSSLFAPTTFLTHKEEWSNFSPSVTEIQNETDMREWFSKNMDFWKRLTNMNYGEELDSRKVELNSLGLTLNAHLEPDRDHLPIWIRVFRRIDPLHHVLDAICKVDDIHKTTLYVTVDGDKFGSIFELLLQVHCVKIKIFFHPFSIIENP
ncbi:hypothetical protein C9374_006360 [Naegleria lovaniensis]|uniref:Uncharacterized protein n=1 Tax=Naegleria lovaniensis TaxID=51637 RepID=A0AA88GLK6_NAELO|nr:uncharacterized protein C9374_006360 [Naegleria lovaniensis]KAG2381371.1 hypothetical protein C9374_006360 [Naegleria lovaniensis]